MLDCVGTSELGAVTNGTFKSVHGMGWGTVFIILPPHKMCKASREASEEWFVFVEREVRQGAETKQEKRF